MLTVAFKKLKLKKKKKKLNILEASQNFSVDGVFLGKFTLMAPQNPVYGPAVSLKHHH